MIIDAQQLLAAVSSAVFQRGTLKVLEYIRLRAEGGQVLLSSTDLELEREDRLAFTGDPIDAVCLEGAKLKSSLRGLVGDITLTLDTSNPDEPVGLLSQGPRRYRLPGLPANLYPARDDLAREPLTLDVAAVGEAMAAVRYATAKRDVRYYLEGVHLGNGRVEATDGFQVARALVDGLPDDEPGRRQLILPASAVAPMAALMTQADARILLIKDRGDLSGLEVVTPSVRMSAKLIDGKYPNVDRVMPNGEPAAVLRLDPTEALPALSRLKPMATVSAQKFTYTAVTLTLKPGADHVVMATADGSCDVVPAKFDVADTVVAAYNADFLMETCGAESGEVEMQWYDQNRGTAMLMLMKGQHEHVLQGLML